MGFTHGGAIAVHLLNAVEESTAIGQSREGRGDDRWASARAEAIKRRVLGGEDLIYARIALVRRFALARGWRGSCSRGRLHWKREIN